MAKQNWRNIIYIGMCLSGHSYVKALGKPYSSYLEDANL